MEEVRGRWEGGVDGREAKSVESWAAVLSRGPRQISLNHNQLNVLPHSVGELSQLTMLRIAHNRLAALPITMGEAPPHLRPSTISTLPTFPPPLHQMYTLLHG